MKFATMEEEDYMSDKFLQPIATQTTPLNKNKTFQRKRKLEKIKSESDLKSKFKPKHVVEHEQREKGLSTSLSTDNLGFKMMAKMGYKHGDGLGKKGEGRSEPVPIQLKSNRFGFGKESSDKEKLNARKKLKLIVAEKKLKLELIQQQDFRSRMSKKFNLQQTERDLGKSQTTCYQLDSSEEIEAPLYEFFWPNHIIEVDEEEAEDTYEDDYTAEDKLAMITNYLREKYFYCVWCASKYNDLNDLMQHCPGDTAAIHDDW